MIDAALLDQFEQQIQLKAKHFSSQSRKALCDALSRQYQDIQLNGKVADNLVKLSNSNTFTITTGHQLCLMTGPLYFIYKILNVIKLSEDLNKAFVGQHFVPVYWMASEDHDFEEIRSFLLFGQKWTWESEQKGAVGRFDTTDLAPLLAELRQKFQNQPDSEIHGLLEKLKTTPYAKGFFEFVNELFSAYGLLIIDADNQQLKESAWPLWQKELYSDEIHQAVLKQSKKLQDQGLSTPIESKASNLFFLGDKKRERIEKNKPLNFQEQHSFELSPNVVLRPLYQEWILPNLAYIGGPSEIAYWQQLPLAFDTLQLPYPLILKRAGGILLQEREQELIRHLGFENNEFLSDKAVLKDRYLNQVGDQVPNYSQLDEYWSGYKSSFLKIATDELPQETRMVEAELTRIQKQIEGLEQRFEKARKAKYDKALKQIDQLSEKIQPKGQLQERSLNILNFCPDGQLTSRIEQIYCQLDPYCEEKQWFVVS